MRVPITYLNKINWIDLDDEYTNSFIVQVSMDITNRQFFENRYIVGLLAIDIKYQEEVIDLFKDSDDNTIDIEDLYDYLLTGVLWKEKLFRKLDLPIKGENIRAVFEYDGGQLKCTHLAVLGKVVPKKIKIDKIMFDNE